MKIAIDISQVIYGTGVSTYTKNLVENLLEIDTKNEYLLFGGSLRRRKDLVSFAEGFKKSLQTKIFTIPPMVSDLIANGLHFPKIERLIGKIDVYHSSDWTQFPSNAFKVTTVHDLAPIFLPKFTSRKIIDVHKRRLRWVIREVDRVIVPSEATKMDIVKLGVNPDKVKVIYEALDPSFSKRSPEEVEEVKRKYKIYGNYVMGVGVNPRKNTDRLIEAYSKAKSDELKLVLIGYPYSGLKQDRGVSYLGHVPAFDLAALYSGAECLVYPSLYEGFGLPILEAFASGCPVVTSNISSMPEIAGDAAILVDPYDTSSIAEGIKKALRGKIGFSKLGLKRIQKFSWKDAAASTLEVYEQRS